ncbi:MAG: PKD domain-containing protein [Candidatus Saccharimonadales bacterium]|jgi:hypothetical protein
MKSLSKLAAIATGFSILAIATFSLSPVLADSPGQIQGGNIYRIQNITQKTDFANPATANACDELEYSAQLHNDDYQTLNSVVVTVTLPSTVGTSNVSTLKTQATNGDPSSTTATTTLNLTSAQSVSYVNGTTELLDAKGNLIEKLPDTITSTGVNIGNLAGSTIEYVNFEAKVSCPTPAPQPVYTCNLLNVTQPAANQIQADVQYTAQNGATFENVTYNFGDNSTPLTTTNTSTTYTYAQAGTYNVTATVAFSVNGATQTATSANCAKTITTTSQLVNTGPGDIIGLFGAATIAGAVLHRLFGRRFAHRNV